MLAIEAPSADAAWRQLAQRVRDLGHHQAGRDQPTRELLHVACTVSDPRQRLVYARPMNPAFAIAEVIWILAGANDVAFLRFWNPRMVRFTDADKRVLYGAYGDRLGSRPRLRTELAQALRHPTRRGEPLIDQLRTAYEILRHDPTSRQVVLQIWDSRRDLPNPTPRSKDVPCNLVSHLLVRDGRLGWLQVMRSNDLFWGLPYNLVQWTTMQELVAGWLELDVGAYNHVSNSLHVYERHWTELEQLETATEAVPMNRADLRIGPYAAWEALWPRVVDAAMALTRHPQAEQLVAVGERHADLPPAYAEWVALLTAEALRRRGYEAAAEEAIQRAGVFWEASWRRWAAAIRAVSQQHVDAVDAQRLDRDLVEAVYRYPDRLLHHYSAASISRRARMIQELGELLDGAMRDQSASPTIVQPLDALASIVETEEAIGLRALAQETIDRILLPSETDEGEDHLSNG
jgi:thymidylate synthase